MSANPHRFHAGWSGCCLFALAVVFAAGCQKAQPPVVGGREVEPEIAHPSQSEPQHPLPEPRLPCKNPPLPANPHRKEETQ